VGIESAIVDCTREPPALLRPGQLSRAQIEAVLGQPLAAPDAASPRAPGMLASHYAPTAPLRLLDSAALHQALDAPAQHPAPASGGWGGPVIGVYSRLPLSGPHGPFLHRPMARDAAGVAHELFSVLRELDAAQVASIWVEAPPPEAAWDGVRDRLQRAAA
jgi:L-threonylcarbamoyladenylate synthase